MLRSSATPSDSDIINIVPMELTSTTHVQCSFGLTARKSCVIWHMHTFSARLFTEKSPSFCTSCLGSDVSNADTLMTSLLILSVMIIHVHCLSGQRGLSSWVTVPSRLPVSDTGSRLWNNLPYEITSVPTLPVFSSRLKTYLFQLSFPPDWTLFTPGLQWSSSS